MKSTIKRNIICFHALFSFVFIELSLTPLIYGSNCNNLFNNYEHGIDYALYHPSVVRIQSEGQKKVDPSDIIRALNYMLADDTLVDTVEPIMYQLRWVQKKKGNRYFEHLMNFFSMVPALYRDVPGYVEELIKYMYLSKTFEQNLRDVLEVINGYNRTDSWLYGGNCSAVVVSSNVLLTAAHCIFNRVAIGAFVDGKIVDANLFYHELAVMGSKQKFLFDVGVLIFPEHTFDNYLPLRVKSPYDLREDKMYGAIGIDAAGVKNWGQVNVEKKGGIYLASQSSPFRPSQGESGGPLINSRGEIVGLISGEAEDDSGKLYDMYVDLLSEANYSFLQGLVRQGIKINGIVE